MNATPVAFTKFSYAFTAAATFGSVGVEVSGLAVVRAVELGSADDDGKVGVGSLGDGDESVAGSIERLAFDAGDEALPLQAATSTEAHDIEAMIASAVLVSRIVHPAPPGGDAQNCRRSPRRALYRHPVVSAKSRVSPN
jgi:hypothetical protein